MADEKYVIGAIDGENESKDIIDVNPIVESKWALVQNKEPIVDGEEIYSYYTDTKQGMQRYSSKEILEACVDYMVTVPFLSINDMEPQNKHVGIWIDTMTCVPERTYAGKAK